MATIATRETISARYIQKNNVKSKSNMKIIDGFVLREIAGECVVAGEGLKQIDFNKLISLNATAAYLWKEVADKEFSAQSMADLLMARYGIDESTALSDSKDTIADWQNTGLIE